MDNQNYQYVEKSVVDTNKIAIQLKKALDIYYSDSINTDNKPHAACALFYKDNKGLELIFDKPLYKFISAFKKIEVPIEGGSIKKVLDNYNKINLGTAFESFKNYSYKVESPKVDWKIQGGDIILSPNESPKSKFGEFSIIQDKSNSIIPIKYELLPVQDYTFYYPPEVDMNETVNYSIYKDFPCIYPALGSINTDPKRIVFKAEVYQNSELVIAGNPSGKIVKVTEGVSLLRVADIRLYSYDGVLMYLDSEKRCLYFKDDGKYAHPRRPLFTIHSFIVSGHDHNTPSHSKNYEVTIPPLTVYLEANEEKRLNVTPFLDFYVKDVKATSIENIENRKNPTSYTLRPIAGELEFHNFSSYVIVKKALTSGILLREYREDISELTLDISGYGQFKYNGNYSNHISIKELQNVSVFVEFESNAYNNTSRNSLITVNSYFATWGTNPDNSKYTESTDIRKVKITQNKDSYRIQYLPDESTIYLSLNHSFTKIPQKGEPSLCFQINCKAYVKKIYESGGESTSSTMLKIKDTSVKVRLKNYSYWQSSINVPPNNTGSDRVAVTIVEARSTQTNLEWSGTFEVTLIGKYLVEDKTWFELNISGSSTRTITATPGVKVHLYVNAYKYTSYKYNTGESYSGKPDSWKIQPKLEINHDNHFSISSSNNLDYPYVVTFTSTANMDDRYAKLYSCDIYAGTGPNRGEGTFKITLEADYYLYKINVVSTYNPNSSEYIIPASGGSVSLQVGLNIEKTKVWESGKDGGKPEKSKVIQDATYISGNLHTTDKTSVTATSISADNLGNSNAYLSDRDIYTVTGLNTRYNNMTYLLSSLNINIKQAKNVLIYNGKTEPIFKVVPTSIDAPIEGQTVDLFIESYYKYFKEWSSGASSDEYDHISNYNNNVESLDSFISISKQNSSNYKVTISANLTSTTRKGLITVTNTTFDKSIDIAVQLDADSIAYYETVGTPTYELDISESGSKLYYSCEYTYTIIIDLIECVKKLAVYVSGKRGKITEYKEVVNNDSSTQIDAGGSEYVQVIDQDHVQINPNKNAPVGFSKIGYIRGKSTGSKSARCSITIYHER